MNIQFYTLAPSPHLVGVLDELHRRPSVDLKVIYERKRLSERSWGLHPGEAPHTYLDSWDVGGYGQHVSPTLWTKGLEAAPDVVIVNTSYVSLNTYVLVLRLVLRDIPFVFWAERTSQLSSTLVKRVRCHLLQWIFCRASGFVGPTEDTIQFYRSLLGYGGPATWVPYHRDLSPFLELSLPSPSPKRTCFLVLGTLNHGKGVDTVLRALADVERPTEMFIVGEGPRREILEEMASACRSRHSVRFLGRVPYDQVPELMREADALLFPSRHDGFGMVTMEALAAGRPVVASDAVMSARQYVQPGKNGWILPTDDVPVWRHRIETVIQNAEKIPQWSRAARSTIRSEYNVVEDISRLLCFLEGLLPKKSSSSISAIQE